MAHLLWYHVQHEQPHLWHLPPPAQQWHRARHLVPRLSERPPVSHFTDEERAVRESVGECTAAFGHETLWLNNDDEPPYGYCLHCGAEFIGEDA